jgi:hypothetical protein
MRRRFNWLAIVPMAALIPLAVLLLCASIRADESAQLLPGAKKVQDSEVFAIWDGTWQKGKSTGMQKLDMDQVSVALADASLKITRPDGTWGIEEQRFGSVRFEKRDGGCERASERRAESRRDFSDQERRPYAMVHERGHPWSLSSRQYGETV